MKLPNDRINVIQEILDKTEKEIENMNPVNILIAGKTGVGKSTLINNIFREKLADTGIGKPVTKHLRKISKNGIPIVLYDTRGLELEQTIQQRVKKEMLNLINQNKHSKEAIHVVYYCIQATSSRIEDMELELIKDISENIPVILVLTQALGQPAEDFKRYLENMNLPVAGIQTVMSEPYVISDDYTIPAFGLKELVSKSLEVIPEDAQKAFTNAQQADIERKAKNARRWATRYVASSFGIGFIPIPFSDASVLVPMQITLLAHITAIFGISLDKSSIVSIIAAVGGTGSATFLGKSIVANALKFIPGAGTVIGGVISGTTASIVTSALAASYIEVLSVMAFKEMNGETVNLSFIENLMRKQFKKNIHMKGKKINKKELEFDRNTDSSDYEHLLNIDEDQKIPFYKKVVPTIKNTVQRFSKKNKN
ncbi:YcjF family protein [Marinilactibacillus sp. GCM10026970]|uniref:YcjF family protein n=1 Tax=Marinilactibacillus sp. GCM10026970 TaxID=3252642 RepID=UPI003608405C